MRTCFNFQVVLPSAKAVVDLQPKFDAIQKCPGSRGVIVTGIAPPESEYDFYSRFFCPKNGIGEVSSFNLFSDQVSFKCLILGTQVCCIFLLALLC